MQKLPKKLILKNHQSPGDLVMLSACIRDLHLTYPSHFQTDVRTSCDDLFKFNPYITSLDDLDPEVEHIRMHYPLINESNERPLHFVHAFSLYLDSILGTHIKTHHMKGDIYVGDEEKASNPLIDDVLGKDARYWLIISGGKSDYTAKHWCPDRAQEVVDYFRGKINFVQIGQEGQQGDLIHYNPHLKNVVDLVGKTSLRDWVRLVYHSDGAVCGVTGLMHMSAAIPTLPGRPRNRPAVVIAGGREPPQFIQYPHHQFLHVNGCLPCCDNGGCWKSRVIPLNDGDRKDRELCSLPVLQGNGRVLPKCLDMITAQDVIRSIEKYLAFGSN